MDGTMTDRSGFQATTWEHLPEVGEPYQAAAPALPNVRSLWAAPVSLKDQERLLRFQYALMAGTWPHTVGETSVMHLGEFRNLCDALGVVPAKSIYPSWASKLMVDKTFIVLRMHGAGPVFETYTGLDVLVACIDHGFDLIEPSETATAYRGFPVFDGLWGPTPIVSSKPAEVAGGSDTFIYADDAGAAYFLGATDFVFDARDVNVLYAEYARRHQQIH
jgi:hypothetical protein